MGNQQPNGKKDDKDKEKKKYEAPIPTRVGKKKRVKVIFFMVKWGAAIVAILPQTKLGPNDYREDSPLFTDLVLSD